LSLCGKSIRDEDASGLDMLRQRRAMFRGGRK